VWTVDDVLGVDETSLATSIICGMGLLMIKSRNTSLHGLLVNGTRLYWIVFASIVLQAGKLYTEVGGKTNILGNNI
jgi:hypothetical protein